MTSRYLRLAVMKREKQLGDTQEYYRKHKLASERYELRCAWREKLGGIGVIGT